MERWPTTLFSRMSRSILRTILEGSWVSWIGLSLKPKSKPKLNPYKFTDAKSFMLLTEGLRAFQAYTRERGTLETAEAKLKLAADSYPNDLLSNFYYAYVLAQQEKNRDAALRVFVRITQADSDGKLGTYAQKNVDLLKNCKYPDAKAISQADYQI